MGDLSLSQVTANEAMTILTETQGMPSATRFSRRGLCTVYHHDPCRHAHGHGRQRGVQTLMSALTLGLHNRMRPPGLIPEAVTLVRLVDIAFKRRTRTTEAISLPATQHSATTRDIKAGTRATEAILIARGAIAGASARRPRAEAATIKIRAATEAATTRPHANGPHHTPSRERGHVRLRRSLPPAMLSLQTCQTWSTSFWAWSGPRRRRRLRRANQR